MFRPGPDGDGREYGGAPHGTQQGSERPRFTADLSPFPQQQQFANTHRFVPLGPISAPAVTSHVDDYFSLPSQGEQGEQHAPQAALGYTLPPHMSHQRQKRRSFSANKIRHRSNLLRLYTNDPDNDPHDLAPRVDSLFSPDSRNLPVFDAPEHTQPEQRKNRNPGFHLKLDNLGPVALPVHKVQQQLTAFGSPHLDPGFDVRYSSTRMFEADPLADVNAGQDNVTPLMFPPQTQEHGYFGEYGPQSSGTYDANGYFPDSVIPGGYLNAPPPMDALGAGSDNNSDLDAYLNYLVEEYGMLDLSGKDYGHRFDQDDKVDVHFAPMMPHVHDHHDNAHDTDRNDHNDTHHHKGLPQDLNTHQHRHDELYAPDNHYDHMHDSHGGFHDSYNSFNQHSSGNYDNVGYDHDDQPRQNVHASEPMAVGKHQSPDILSDGPEDRKVTGKKKKPIKGTICSICDRYISRDLTRHMRIHDDAGRFQCVFPPSSCKHKSRKFNRPYDFKKHLLNMHFKFDDPTVRHAPNLTDKLKILGQCIACGQSFIANDWLEKHILIKDNKYRCVGLQRIEQLYRDESDRSERLSLDENISS